MDDSTIEILRRDARKIFRAGLHAVEPAPLVHAALLNAPELRVARRVHIVAIGKAAPSMAAAATEALAGHVASSVVVSTRENLDAAAITLDRPHVTTFAAGHPIPDDNSVAAAREVLRVVTAASRDDVIVVLLSGGASAMMALPADAVTLADCQRTTALLLAAGASVEDLNCVRKHIDGIKRGGLGRAADGRTVVGLVISDVVGNHLDVIGSSPLLEDQTTPADALEIVKKYNLLGSAPVSVISHLRDDRSHVERSSTANIRTQIIADNQRALDACASYARRLGYTVATQSNPVTGNARTAGRDLGFQLRARDGTSDNSCIIAGGETTVTVTGDGVGGRNQEIALAAAIEIAGMSDAVLLSGGTDGVDGPTKAAGGIVDGETCSRIWSAGGDPEALLMRNDSYTALSSSGDLLITGPTGTNVMDVHILLHHGTIER